MDVSVQIVHELVSGIRPWGHLETEHRAENLNWLETTNDVFGERNRRRPTNTWSPTSSWSTQATAVPFWSITSTPVFGCLLVGTWNPASVQRSLPDARLTKKLWH